MLDPISGSRDDHLHFQRRMGMIMVDSIKGCIKDSIGWILIHLSELEGFFAFTMGWRYIDCQCLWHGFGEFFSPWSRSIAWRMEMGYGGDLNSSRGHKQR